MGDGLDVACVDGVSFRRCRVMGFEDSCSFTIAMGSVRVAVVTDIDTNLLKGNIESLNGLPYQ